MIRKEIKNGNLTHLFEVYVKLKKYYCTKCKRYHNRGKIYKKHLQYKKIKKKSSKIQISADVDLKDVSFEDLRPIAQRQILSLLKRMTRAEYPEYYKKRIIRVIAHENKNY